MKNRAPRPTLALLWLLGVLAAQGCGSNEASGEDPILLEGRFVFAVAGLAYTTPTRSGVTDWAGTFQYVEGETVTFAIGGITLGEAPGAPRISPFDLVGAVPPTTERAIRDELRDALNVSDFDRAVNITFFLGSLDADHDLTNGVDATAWGPVLAETALRFDVPMLSFPTTAMRRVAARYDIRRTTPLEVPIVAMYRALGIRVAAQARATFTRDEDADGVLDATHVYAYDAEGHRIERRSTYASGVYTERTTYDAEGRVLRVAPPPDQYPRTEYVHTYDERGQRVLVERIYTAQAGSPPSSPGRNEYTFDAHGNMTLLDETISMSTRIIRTYDDFGEVVSMTSNVAPFQGTTTYTYDEAGRMLTSSFRQIYDTTTAIDRTFTYDALGREIGRVYVYDTYSGTTPNGPVNDYRVTTREYDAAGFTDVTTIDYDMDGLVDGRFLERFRSDGQPVSTLATSNAPGSAIVTRAHRGTWTYGSFGELLSETYEIDPDGDGPVPYAIDDRSTWVYTFDAHGNVRTVDIEELVPFDRERHAYTYTTVDDGLGHLLHDALVVKGAW